MKTYIFIEINGPAVISLSADNEEEAYKNLNELVYFPDGFRLDEELDEE